MTKNGFDVMPPEFHELTSDLTERQHSMFRLLYETVRDKGYQPSMRELMEVFNIKSPNGIAVQFKAMEKKGYLTRPHKKWAKLVILRRPDGSPFTGFQDKPVEAFEFRSEYA